MAIKRKTINEGLVRWIIKSIKIKIRKWNIRNVTIKVIRIDKNKKMGERIIINFKRIRG